MAGKFDKLFGDVEAKAESKRMMKSIAEKLKAKQAKNRLESSKPASDSETQQMIEMAMDEAKRDIEANPGSGGRLKNMVADEFFQKNQKQYLKRLRGN